jgi:hypothetical protein
MNEIQIESFDIEKLRERLRKMSDAQLLEFGRAGRQLCSPEANFDKPPREVFVIQLKEARAEMEKKTSEKMTGPAVANGRQQRGLPAAQLGAPQLQQC